MKQGLLFFFISLAINAHQATAQSNNVTHVPETILIHSCFPCDSLSKIKNLKNVTCDNYVVIRYADVKEYSVSLVGELERNARLEKWGNWWIKTTIGNQK